MPPKSRDQGVKTRPARLELDYVSWWGDGAFGIAIMGWAMALLAVATPSWVSTSLYGVEYSFGDGNQTEITVTIGRGLFQAYSVIDKQISLFTYMTTDISGDSLDPFCGSRDASPLFPLVTNKICNEAFCGRSYDTVNWCKRRRSALTFVLVSNAFGLAAFMFTCLAQRGCMGQIPFILACSVVVVSGLIAFGVLGRFFLHESEEMEAIPVPDRFFPYEQKTKIGYSLALYLTSLVFFVFALFLGIIERACGRSEDDKYDNSRDVERFKAETSA
eukprot:m.187768 g.187768  ORF g.187768 m.187768 type:complete len:274 (+) comp14779_c0_seq1:237-1058(+)